jgi:hypothetical protein
VVDEAIMVGVFIVWKKESAVGSAPMVEKVVDAF